ncbi:hypothetical protein HOY36_06385 [Enterococcus sp. MMGLQ5-2]|uniref:T7SS effector LXG polymorphic toxin n=1 Tax=Enterococcus sp. MMGLQ5-2 TaxID=2737664 RepID=UPI001555A994|nr:T7SS effector LXG polymorphic toxin [Enterococcus sp. MMGLQ5-2]MBS7577160.1 hypothetical protein [Enterococcus sp. MMGLQ5-2]MBS7584393.1 hypothetical protein [Enterococcus sp. MMGLQ5-1]NPD12248.1 hypothetical protein [Enterococcus sp. MMGLQ5-1]NPD36994.1 hypothetical protein [Enterococcus sp. MMGLQ5-2]
MEIFKKGLTNLGLKYASGESSELISALTTNINTANSTIESLKSGSQQLTAAIDGNTLSGAAYTAGKGLFQELIIPTITRVTEATDDVKADLSKYSAANDTVSTESLLDETNLKQQIAIKKASKAAVDAASRSIHLQTLSNPIAKLADALFDTQNRLNGISDDLQDDIDKLQKKLDKLYEFSSAVSGLFSDSLNNFKIAMQGVTVLNNTTVNSDGTYSLPKGTDKSWFTDKKTDDDIIEQNIALLGLPKAAEKYYQKELKKILKNVPKEQWGKTIQEINEGLLFDDEGNLLLIGKANFGSGDGLIVLKNGKYDEKLTKIANQEANAEHWEKVKDNSGKLIFGLAALLGGGGLGLLSGTVTVGSGGTLAPAGVAGLLTSESMIAYGIGALGATVATVGAASSISGVSSIEQSNSGLNYSFAKNYDDRVSSSSKSVNNMDEFFDTEFGSEIKDNLSKTTKRVDGQTVYKVEKDMPKYGLKKKDQIYLDGLHKDHLEIFNKRGHAKEVRNLDGTINEIKSKKINGRTIN